MQDISLPNFDAIYRDRVQPAGPVANESVNKDTEKHPTQSMLPGSLKDWLIVILLVIFVTFYALAFAGKLDPFKDNSMLLRFEPIIFILLGYYFGRLPARENGRAFKAEIERHIQRAEAAQYAKEKVLQERDALEERIENARKVISSGRSPTGEAVSVEAVELTSRILGSN